MTYKIVIKNAANGKVVFEREIRDNEVLEIGPRIKPNPKCLACGIELCDRDIEEHDGYYHPGCN